MRTQRRTDPTTFEPWLAFGARNLLRFAVAHALWVVVVNVVGSTTIGSDTPVLEVVLWLWSLTGLTMLMFGFPVYLAVLLRVDRRTRPSRNNLVRWLSPIVTGPLWILILWGWEGTTEDALGLVATAMLTIAFGVVASPRRRPLVASTA
jgi:hypothetical protein